MDRRESDDAALGRWLVLNVLRLAGAAMVLTGLVMVAGRMGGGAVIGYILIAAGLIGVFAVPLWLARRWRSPRE